MKIKNLLSHISHLISQFYKLLRTLSIDVAFGACASSWGIAQMLGLQMPWVVLWCLGLAVWVIYTVDHLMDARKIKHPASTFRHAFHQLHFRTLSLAALLMALSGLFLLFFLPAQTLWYGLTLVGLVSLYFVILKWFYRNFAVWKEHFIATIYTSGIFVGPVSLYEGPLYWEILLIMLQFLFLALINLLEFSYFEKESDVKDGHYSFVFLTGKKRCYELIRLLLVLILLIMSAVAVVFYNERVLKMEVIIFMMLSSLYLILYYQKYFSRKERYRMLGDLIFLYPLIMGL